MPISERQRRFMFAELNRRKNGKSRLMKGLTTKKLKKLAHSPLESELKRGKK